ncbi:protein FAM234B [Oreochromis niloticus]|uniref:Family with sequence similarity 234 member B n=1 Tax=Oreochromis niloticus TaxID=8128 RepID=I3JNS8_ORENI|nr:protein FAM234B [Oreochromis niloticus]
MAAALSRALKLPGKKGSELGEYDPLTQADSDDESEEDDLVLNYPRNGLGRDSCLGTGSSKLRGGRSGRLVGAEDGVQDDEEDEEEDEWRERLPSKSRQDRNDMKGVQYWSHRDSGGERKREDRGGPGALGGAGLGLHSSDEQKRMRVKNAIRSAFFLVPLVCATVVVLLCAFLIPCQKGDLEKRLQWEKALLSNVETGGVTPPALALWDVDGDSVEDVFLGVTEPTNETHTTQTYSAVALSAVSGQVLWKKVMSEAVMYIQCGLQYSTVPSPVCLLICKSYITAVNGTTGKKLWSSSIKSIESQAVLLPDLQGDSHPDLLVATLPADDKFDLSLTLISGETGALLGHPVPFNVTAQGTLIGPWLYETQQGVYYILFGLGNVKAISLRDIYFRATGKLPETQALRKKDSGWEGMKKDNFSSVIQIYSPRDHDQAKVLLPLVAGFGRNHNNLDTASNLDSTRSDWVLVYGGSIQLLLRQRNLRKKWTYKTTSIHSQPVAGHFNSDGVLDLFIQHSSNGVMKTLIIDGANGTRLWAAEFVCPQLRLETSAISTSTGQSAFLFWASDPIKAQKNVTKTTVSPDVAVAEPLIRKLYLLHPTYPTVLLELASTTDTAVTSAVSYQDHQKDASYITVSSRPTPGSVPSAWIVKSVSLRAAITKGQIVWIGDGSKTAGALKPAEVSKFFRRLTFRHQ